MCCGIALFSSSTLLLSTLVQYCKVSAVEGPIRAKYQLKTGHHPIGLHLSSRSADSHFGREHNLVGVSKQRGDDVRLVFGAFVVIKVILPKIEAIKGNLVTTLLVILAAHLRGIIIYYTEQPQEISFIQHFRT